ncbi:MAG TPA: hypothetical protein VI997_11785 [Candidatus Thermoplasmatota archaeon]|nr:hypothetical protein [Candidatus Thermoplasmatota archaeon]
MALPRAWSLPVLAVLVATSWTALGVSSPSVDEGDFWTYSIPIGETPAVSKSIVKDIRDDKVVIESNVWVNQSTTTPVGPITTSTRTFTNQTLREHDGAVISVITRTESSSGGIGASGPQTVTTTITYEPPCVVTRFPFNTVGATWSVNCPFTWESSALGGQSRQGTLKADYEVKAHESVTVPAGTFTAYKIVNVTGGKDNGASWWAPAACATIKGTDASGKTAIELTSFECDEPGTDDFMETAPPEEEPPAEEEQPPAEEEEPPAEEEEQEPPVEEPSDDGGIPAPGAIAALAAVGAAAVVASRRR